MIERESTVLPRAGLADDAERLAALERERDAVDRAHEPAVGLEVRLEVGDLEERPVGRGVSRIASSVTDHSPGRRSGRARRRRGS